jgi:hypothetical protein
LVLALTIICCIWMIIVTVLGDFCMDPTSNTLNQLKDMSFYDTANYFFTCTGTNPLTAPQDDLEQAGDQLLSALDQLITTGSVGCYQNADLILANASLTDAFVQIDDLMSAVSCVPIQYAFQELVHEGLCTHSFTGMFALWIGLFVCSGCLFLLNFVSGILYQYFGPVMWNMGNPKFVKEPFDASHEVLYQNDLESPPQQSKDGRGSTVPSAPDVALYDEDPSNTRMALELPPLRAPNDQVTSTRNAEQSTSAPRRRWY